MLVFKKFVYAFVSIVSCLFACIGERRSTPYTNSEITYNIVWDEDDELSQRWGEYLYYHLQKRSKCKDMVVYNTKNKGDILSICPEVISGMENDYGISNNSWYLSLKASDDANMLWLIYQCIKNLSLQDERIDASDLPLAVISLKTGLYNFDFAYREPFFRPNLNPEYAPVIGSHTVDNDWGLWGHNLYRVLGEEPPEEVYARQGNIKIYDQYCFSNESVYQKLEEYILNASGGENHSTKWFMIMPNDNPHVCLCETCMTMGNTSQLATPAVASLIQRLAKRFPEHFFFTTAYLSTLLPAGNIWPANTGIMISTINLPKGIDPCHTSQSGDFLQLVNRWKQHTPLVYVWDYAANFDDYLTPLPILYGLSQQLEFYKYHGIKGVFLNASGYDYSSFDDMKTFVSAALMQDNSYSVDSLCRNFYREFYPVTGSLLSGYYLSLEKRMQERKRPYSLYGGFKESVELYLDRDEFVFFYDSLTGLVNQCKDEELENIELLHIALTYTRLQFAWMENDYNMAKSLLPQMEKYKYHPYMSKYREEGGDLSTYLKNWKYHLNHSRQNNLFTKQTLEPLSLLDEEYQDLSVLTDGIRGFSDNYHQGWLLCSGDDLHVEYRGTDISKKGTLTLHFLSNPRYRIYPPEKVEVYKNGQIYKVLFPCKDEKVDGLWLVSGKMDFSDARSLSFKMYRPDNSGTIACDEIVFN